MFHVKHFDPGVMAAARVLELAGLSSALLSPLSAHAHSVAEASPRLGLVSTGDEGVVLARHTADALLFALARAPQPRESWVDLGSGGGFPGLVLAICYQETQFTLVDSNRKKAGFLQMEALNLGLRNVRVEAVRADAVQKQFDVGVARALAEPEKAIAMLRALIRPGGTILVAGIGQVTGAETITLDVPDVDSPRTLFMIASTFEKSE